MQSNNNKNLARWPNSIGDYLAAGRPIIANGIGELKELQDMFPSGMIIMESTDDDYVYDKLLEVYEIKQNLRNNYRAIREFACANFSWDFRAEELDSIYWTILRGKQFNKNMSISTKITSK